MLAPGFSAILGPMTHLRFTRHDVDHYHAHGYVLLRNFLDAQELAQVHEELEWVIPGWRCAVDPAQPKPDGWRAPPELPTNTRFPFRGATLNAMTFHPELRRFAATICGHENFFCEQSDITYKCQGHARDLDQSMHMDFGNHTLAYPSSAPKFWQTLFLVYYTDVTEQHAPTAVVPWEHYRDETHWPIVHTRDERPDLYAHEQLATVPAGSVLAYSTRTYHRGTAFQSNVGRVAHFISYAPAGCPWLGIVGWPAQGVKKSYHRWLEQASVAERDMLGFPPVGHEYWTEETIRGVQARFPALDVTPYREGLKRP